MERRNALRRVQCLNRREIKINMVEFFDLKPSGRVLRTRLSSLRRSRSDRTKRQFMIDITIDYTPPNVPNAYLN